MARTCSLEGCDRAHEGHGYCRLHYRRWAKHGDPLHVEPTKPRQPRTDAQAREVLLSRREITTAGCWEYTGHRAPTGYGQFGLHGKQTTAHRASYALFVGPIPDGMFVCHECDNPPCFNPEHLFVAPPEGNNADMDAKGRARRVAFSRQPNPEERARGERNGSAKLTEDQVRTIRSDGRTQKQVAAAFGVSLGLVAAIRQRRVWKHVD